ncbi:MAG: hypothetical protein K9N62_17610 [Verrucomicrobia bacterium]|jgi:hypothetical protein|nr:hypothetical protein [Verrucomicrobiota bacterium]
MASEDKPNRLPWQPLTFKGIARLGRAPLGRLMAVQCVVAAIVAASVLTTVLVSWKPVITETLLRLPDQGGIRDGTLAWFGPEPVRLANNSFLSVVVELIPNGSLGLSADLQLEFGRRELRSRSILGYLAVPYPVDWVIPANRKQLEPWWGAWNWPVMGGLALGVFFGLQVLWWLLAVVYAWPVRLIAFYSDRQISLPQSFKLAAASLLPGALLFSACLVAYAFQRINLIELLLAHVLHLVIGWLYVVVAPFRLPRLGAAPSNSKSENPFND